MQRRAAAVYAVFFLVVGVAAYSYIGVAQETRQPQFSVDGQTLGGGDTTTIGGTTYTIAAVGHEGGGDGHGGGGEGPLVATLEWTNESARQSTILENGSSATIDGESWTVVVPNGSSSATLREEFNVTGILHSDPAVRNDLATVNDTDHVVYRGNESVRPLSEYLPEPDTRTVTTGDTVTFEGTEATVGSVTSGGVTLEWREPADRSVDLQEGTNVTLANGEHFFAHFPSENAVTLVPADQYDGYATTVAERAAFDHRVGGLFGVTILSGLAAFLLLSLAYLPTRG